MFLSENYRNPNSGRPSPVAGGAGLPWGSVVTMGCRKGWRNSSDHAVLNRAGFSEVPWEAEGLLGGRSWGWVLGCDFRLERRDELCWRHAVCSVPHVP